MLLETKDRSSVDGDASFINESAVLSELRADIANSAGESRMKLINFFLRIPKFGCLLFALRKVFDEAHLAPIGEANLFFSWSRHLVLCREVGDKHGSSRNRGRRRVMLLTILLNEL